MNAEIVEERHTAGELSDAAYDSFQAIIEAARKGKWESAERQAIAYQKAQRPTEADIDRLRSNVHGHEHG